MQMKLKLSESIRLGSLLYPQARGKIVESFLNIRGERSYGVCAIGAALLANGFRIKQESTATLVCPEDLRGGDYRWPGLPVTTLTHCPSCGNLTLGPDRICAHLNDRHMWTREQIAAWVQEQEEAYARQQQTDAESQPEPAVAG